MGCLVGLLVLATPRLVMVVLWIFTDYLSRAYDTWILPLIGFFVLPTTTLAYAVAVNQTNGLRGWSLLLVDARIVTLPPQSVSRQCPPRGADETSGAEGRLPGNQLGRQFEQPGQ